MELFLDSSPLSKATEVLVHQLGLASSVNITRAESSKTQYNPIGIVRSKKKKTQKNHFF